jgi:hypothetical protein
MTPEQRIQYWLSRQPLAKANQENWVKAVFADGMRAAECTAADVSKVYASMAQPEKSAAAMSVAVEIGQQAGKISPPSAQTTVPATPHDSPSCAPPASPDGLPKP